MRKGCSFGKRLRILRKRRGMTQKELGLRMGYPESSASIRIAQYEGSDRHPKQHAIEKLAEILNVTPYALLSNAACSTDDLLQGLIWTEEIVGIDAVEACLRYWSQLRKLRDNGALTPEQYLEIMVCAQPVFSASDRLPPYEA